MTEYEKLEILGKAFCDGNLDKLKDCLFKDCKYNSDYAKKHIDSAERILDHMRTVNENVRNHKDTDVSYTYSIVDLSDILKDGITLSDLTGETFFSVYEKGLFLCQYGEPEPASVVFVKFNPAGTISEINLSRNTKWFDVKFNGSDDMEDSEKDIPYTVKPMTSSDRQVREMQDYFRSQPQEFQELEDSEVYIWRRADRFFKDWARDFGYYLHESEVFDDCIGYKCSRGGRVFTIYMFAMGQVEKVYVNGEYCASLPHRDFSEGTVLVTYLCVKREQMGKSMHYTVGFYPDAGNEDVVLWHPCKVNDKNTLLYYPGETMLSATEKFVYAFNNENLDALSCVVSEDSPLFTVYDNTEHFADDEFIASMARMHKIKGDMLMGYVSFNDVVFSRVPYIDGYGWFEIGVDGVGKINRIRTLTFDVAGISFIKNAEKIPDNVFGSIPKIVSVQSLPKAISERFAVKATFDDGSIKKYVLPITRDDEEKEAVSYHNHDFTDDIWKTAKAIESPNAWYEGFGRCMPGVIFDNGIVLSGMLIYEDGTDYSEPVKCAETVYEDENYKLEKIWTWNANNMYEDENTGLLKVLLNDGAFNYDGISTIASVEGDRLSSLEFVYLKGSDDSDNGMILAGVRGRGYGFIGSEGKFCIPPIYERADGFIEDYAHVMRDGKWLFINKDGKEIDLSNSYEDIAGFSEGLCRVSTLKLSFMDLAYHSDDAEVAGVWGFVNEEGREIIPPQYIYAYDFNKGVAIVCKGEWTKDPKWDNEYNQGRYWTDVELWGGIDKEGKEVIPFIFDEIKPLWDDEEEVYMAHYGGWKNGKWGVINKDGKWLADPVFEDIDYSYHNGLFAFYGSNKWDGDDVPLGVYDTNQKRVLFEPQFKDVYFVDDDYIEVEVYDEKLGKDITKIIDLDGNEKFPSKYTSIRSYMSKSVWIVTKEIDGEKKDGLIDSNGKEILPCKYDIKWGSFSLENRVIANKVGDKCGVIDFDGNTIISPDRYDDITGFSQPLFTVYKKTDQNNKLEGLVTRDGREILPPIYKRVSVCKDSHVICVDDSGCTMMRFSTKNVR